MPPDLRATRPSWSAHQAYQASRSSPKPWPVAASRMGSSLPFHRWVSAFASSMTRTSSSSRCWAVEGRPLDVAADQAEVPVPLGRQGHEVSKHLLPISRRLVRETVKLELLFVQADSGRVGFDLPAEVLRPPAGEFLGAEVPILAIEPERAADGRLFLPHGDEPGPPLLLLLDQLPDLGGGVLRVGGDAPDRLRGDVSQIQAPEALRHQEVVLLGEGIERDRRREDPGQAGLRVDGGRPVEPPQVEFLALDEEDTG